MATKRRLVAVGIGGAALALALAGLRLGPTTYADSDPAAKYGAGLRTLLARDPGDQAGRPGIKDADTLSVIIRAQSDVSPRLRALGVNVRSVVGNGAIITADVPRGVLPEVGKLGAVAAIEAPVLVSPTNDLSAQAMQVDKLQTQMGLDGTGVLVGVVDTGIDFTHGDFKNADGSSRILRIWDQSVNGTPPSSPPGANISYGNECIGPNFSGCTEIDESGHGTHVAGTAAGNGNSTSSKAFQGMAPKADIAIVKTTFTSDKIIDAWTYLINLAKSRNQPIVINNSLTSQFGPHDGTGQMDQTLDALSAPGVVFVVAAGNDAARGIHQQATLANGVSKAITWGYTGPGTAFNRSNIGIYTDVANQVSYAINLPAGLTLTNKETGGSCPLIITPGPTVVVNCVSPAGDSVVINSGLDPFSGKSNVLSIDLSFKNNLSGTWSVNATGTSIGNTGLVDAYLGYGSESIGAKDIFTNPTAAGTVGEPGTAKKAITVGAYVTRNSWTCEVATCKGGTVKYPDPLPAIGSVSTFSGIGTTRDGRNKPEVIAPGQGIFSAKSKDQKFVDPLFVSVDGQHYLLQGTSMATPGVSGVIALLLQKNRLFGPDEIVTALIKTATGNGGAYKADSGFGKVDALAAANLLLAGTPTPASTTISPVSGGTLTNNNGSLQLTFPPGAVSEPITVTYQPLTVSGPPGAVGLASFALTAASASGPVTQFGTTITITVTYNPAQLGGLPESKIQIYFQQGDGNWVALKTTVDPVRRTAMATVDHFTVFGVFASPDGPDAGSKAFLPALLKAAIARSGW